MNIPETVNTLNSIKLQFFKMVSFTLRPIYKDYYGSDSGNDASSSIRAITVVMLSGFLISKAEGLSNEQIIENLKKEGLGSIDTHELTQLCERESRKEIVRKLASIIKSLEYSIRTVYSSDQENMVMMIKQEFLNQLRQGLSEFILQSTNGGQEIPSRDVWESWGQLNAENLVIINAIFNSKGNSSLVDLP